MNHNKDIMVSILCIAFNHERYIAQTLDGFLMQKTSFPFEVMIHDDASHDSTADIIREYEKKYPDIIRGIYQTENQYSKNVPLLQKMVGCSRGKYIALCEGDDFWIDPNKLQKQVDRMESDPGASLCATSGYYAYENGVLKNHMFKPFEIDRLVSAEETVIKWLFPTASLVIRREFIHKFSEEKDPDVKETDYMIIMNMAIKGNVYYLAEPTCVYRQMSVSSMSRMQRADPEVVRMYSENKLLTLRRFDEITEGKYKDAVKEAEESTKYAALWALDDIKGLRKNSVYKNMDLKSRVRKVLSVKSDIMERHFQKRRTAYEEEQYRIALENMKTCTLPNIKILDDIE